MATKIAYQGNWANWANWALRGSNYASKSEAVRAISSCPYARHSGSRPATLSLVRNFSSLPRADAEHSPFTRRHNLLSHNNTYNSQQVLMRLFSSSRVPCRENTIQVNLGEGGAVRAERVASEDARLENSLVVPDHLNEAESLIYTKLSNELKPTKLEVQDISGGCGSMYGIEIVSEKFKGLSMLKQQRLVNEVLGEEIKGWHGVQLKTRAP